MPSYGEKQMPAGKKLKGEKPFPREKTMKVINKGFTIDSPMYKGNAVLNANK